MTRVLISNRLQRDFAMVPNALWRSDLPFAAKGVACYLLSLRDGSMPYVAEMEAALGMGRDARRKAFAALEAAGFLSWRIERNARRVIVAKTLVLDPLVFDVAEAVAARAPESQADGETPSETFHAPENPAGGNSVPVGAETRRCRDGKSGDPSRQKKIKGAMRARASRAVGPPSGVGSVSSVRDLTPFQSSQLLAGRSVLIDGALMSPDSPAFRRLARDLRAIAENGEAVA